MTYRTNPTTGDRVSLLGFGMMRSPAVGAPQRHRGDRPEAGERARGSRHRSRRQLLRHIARLLPRILRAGHGNGACPLSAPELLHRHQTVELLARNMEPMKSPKQKHLTEAQKKEAVDAAIENMGLKPYEDRYPGELSGGQRQEYLLQEPLWESHPFF